MSWPHHVGNQQQKKLPIGGNTPSTPAKTSGGGLWGAQAKPTFDFYLALSYFH